MLKAEVSETFLRWCRPEGGESPLPTPDAVSPCEAAASGWGLCEMRSRKGSGNPEVGNSDSTFSWLLCTTSVKPLFWVVIVNGGVSAEGALCCKGGGVGFDSTEPSRNGSGNPVAGKRDSIFSELWKSCCWAAGCFNNNRKNKINP